MNNRKDDLDTPYASTGYSRLPFAAEVMKRSEKFKRAPEVSPLLKEWLEKQNKDRT